MKITVHIPSPPLDTYIKCLWYCEGAELHQRVKILPMPSLHLMINFGDPFHVYRPGQDQPFANCAASWSVGLWNAYHVMDWPREMQILNVSFKPAGAYPFLQIPLSELHNQIVPMDAIWGGRVAEIRERLYFAPGIQARFALLEQLLLTRLREVPYGLTVAQHAIAEITRAQGTVPIRSLSDWMGISQKHLITQFSRFVGASPKQVARIYRFKHVLYSLNPILSVDWTQIAFQAGFYDQSHFTKEFEAFAGYTPTDYLRLLHQAQTEMPELARYPQHVPTG